MSTHEKQNKKKKKEKKKKKKTMVYEGGVTHFIIFSIKLLIFNLANP